MNHQIKKQDIERFFKRVKFHPNGCWKWLGLLTKFGSGGYTDNLPRRVNETKI